ncbi:EboA domain-containing protein [Amycolatopsis sp. 195334CR]|uniref:EboA domain-containing protein n=1 Tax=Amycolatopsis sp. 195334CR TaxID=2814588 RepID=UPI001A8F91BD|nr:EboA domain-containing protein [Amycolatopsis sp. 195334CR]MBN6036313.1 sugar phosphate isomerase/epimerase [Amycolatopsis sp. 195334CR]
MTFSLGYGTNGFANHRLLDALAVIADLGYTGVALTLDHDHLNPYADDLPKQLERVAARLSSLGLNRVVIETGARYLLDPWRKHHPTLLSDDPAPRLGFLERAMRIAAELDADCVSFWSGVKPPDLDDATAGARLREGLQNLLLPAEALGVRVGMEPEPGHFVQHLQQVLDLREQLGNHELFGVTLDVGHCVAVEPVDAAECVRLAGPLLFNVQLDDMLPNVHEHLEFGEGQLDLPATLGALTEIGYEGLAAVELPRHSHAAPEVAARAFRVLNLLLPAEADHPWVVDAVAQVRAKPDSIGRLFPAAGRGVGRTPVAAEADPQGLVQGTLDDQARVRLLTELNLLLPAEAFAAEVGELYRYGDDAERRGVLRGLNALDKPDDNVVAAGLQLVADALRTNDTRLVAAAMGAFAATHLDAHSWRHGVLKCLFTGVPLAAVAELDRRVDDELRRMVSDYAAERSAAGREVPADARAILERGEH